LGKKPEQALNFAKNLEHLTEWKVSDFTIIKKHAWGTVKHWNKEDQETNLKKLNTRDQELVNVLEKA
jgi:hypothetical protein